MIRIVGDTSRPMKLASGVFWCWLKAFGDDVKKPSKWGQGMVVLDFEVTFTFVKVEGARSVEPGSYVLVEVSGDPSHSYFIMKESHALFPVSESVNGDGFQKYLSDRALVHFTEEQLEEWTEKGKMVLM